MMTAFKAFIALCLLALVGTALVVGPTELRRLLPDGTKTAVAARPEAKVEPKAEEPKSELKPEQPKLAAGAPPAPAASPAPEPKAGALAETQSQVTAALADLAPVKPLPPVADSGPRFDVARVDDHGEAAVIAGRATPGARVELLRDGKPLDSVVADASGQFVMTPPQLPPGSYELTLRAKAPDGTVTESGRTMPVTIAEAAPPPARPAPAAKQAEKPDDKPDVVAALPSASPADVLAAAPAQSGGSRVIARGDSLWALSRLAYGDGARYAVIFKANRDKINNPNLIYPGQTFVMPQKAE